jgi:hypothetical protein
MFSSKAKGNFVLKETKLIPTVPFSNAIYYGNVIMDIFIHKLNKAFKVFIMIIATPAGVLYVGILVSFSCSNGYKDIIVVFEDVLIFVIMKKKRNYMFAQFVQSAHD